MNRALFLFACEFVIVWNAVAMAGHWALVDESGHTTFGWSVGQSHHQELVVHLDLGHDGNAVDATLRRTRGAFSDDATVTIMQGGVVAKRTHVGNDGALTYSNEEGTIVFSVVGDPEHPELDGIVVGSTGVLHVHAKADGTLDVINNGDVLGVCGANETQGDHRRRLLVERWTDCYDGDSVTRAFSIGVVIASGVFERRFSNNEEQVTSWINSVVAEANVVYRTQLNLVLTVGDLVIQRGSEGAPSWDDPKCELGLRNQLSNFRSWQQPSKRGVWHLFDDCYGVSGSSIGLATMLVADPAGTICMMDKVNGGTEYWNTAVSWYSASTWKTFAHEVGHNFGASHSFENGVGETGGIMDYGDGKLNGEFQFNTQYRKTEICTSIQKVVGTCSAFSALGTVTTISTTTGSGNDGTGAPSTTTLTSTTVAGGCNNDCIDKLGAGSVMTFNGVQYRDCAALIAAANQFRAGYWCSSSFESQVKVCQLSCGACNSDCGQGTSTTIAAIMTTTTTSTTTKTTTRTSTRTTTGTTSTSSIASTTATTLATVTTAAQDTVVGIQSGDTVFLKTRLGSGSHIEIEGSEVQSRWQSRGDWQAMVIEKEGGGSVNTGDTVYFKTHTGAYIDVADETVRARWNEKGDWQALVIKKRTGNGIIVPNDLVCFRAHTGKHIDVEGTVPQARWDACEDWQTMLIEREVVGAVFSGDAVNLLAHTGKRVDVQNDVVQARWSEAGAWQTFVIENYGGRAIFSGDAVFLKAHTDVYVDVEGATVQARWSDRGSWQQLVIEKRDGSGAVMPGDTVYLRAHTGNMVDVQDAAVQARWSERGDWQSLVIEAAPVRRLAAQDDLEFGGALAGTGTGLLAVAGAAMVLVGAIALVRHRELSKLARPSRSCKVLPTKDFDLDASSH